jgi:hypothetical protein
MNEEYELFNRIAESLNEELFNSFLNIYIDKIIAMFIYVLENVTTYPYSALDNIYCDLPVYDCDSSSDDSVNNKEQNRLFKNVQVVEKFLTYVRQKVEAVDVYSKREDFDFERK